MEHASQECNERTEKNFTSNTSSDQLPFPKQSQCLLELGLLDVEILSYCQLIR